MSVHPSAPIIESEAWERGRDRKIAALLFLVVWVVYLATATYSGVQINDNRATNMSAWSVVERGTLALPEGDQWGEDLRWADPGADGRYYTDRFPGTIAHGVPFHLVASWFGINEDPQHPVQVNYAAGGVAAATVSAAFVAALYAVFRQLVDRRFALIGALVAAFATATWSVSADALWTHGPTSLWLTLGMLALARERHARAGLAFAVSVLSRPQTAVAPAVVGTWRGIARRQLHPVAVIGLTSALGAVGMSIYSKLVFDTWLPVGGYNPGKLAAVAATESGVFLERVVQTFANPYRGVLIVTPFLLILLPFVRHGWRIAPDWVRSSAVAGIAYMAVQLRANDWAGGGHFYGSRLTIEMLVLAAPLLLLTAHAVFRRRSLLRAALQGALAVAFAIHLVGAAFMSVGPEGRDAWRNYVQESCEEYVLQNCGSS